MTPTSVLAIGEVLWDVFPDGPRFGGAPANFVCAVAGLGGTRVQAAIASAVGNDDLGNKARQKLNEANVGTELLAKRDFVTGRVDVHLDAEGLASYIFAENTAWDHVPWTDQLEVKASRADVVCFGTLGQRSDESRQTIQSAIKATSPKCLRIFDINLRPPFWTRELIAESLAIANVLKLNDDELPVLAEMTGLRGSDDSILQGLIAKYDLQLTAITRGANGALLLNCNGERSEIAGSPVAVLDTVGAGDSFTAALALGLVNNLPFDVINRWANQVAAYVCTQPGGTPRFPQHLHLSELLKQS